MRMIDRGWKQTVLAALRYTALLGMIVAWGVSIEAESVRPIPSATKVAGTGLHGFNNDFGPASGVELSVPVSNLFDAQGNQYISDSGNNCVRKVDTTGNISTLAGLDQAGPADTCDSSLNSTPTAAKGLLAPTGLALDSLGNLYIADTGHNCVRKLGSGATGTANLVTVVGDCTLSMTASVGPAPWGLAFDANGNLYVSTQDAVNQVNQVLLHRANDSALTVCRVAGAASALVSTSCRGGIVPTLSKPAGLAFDPVGNLFIADSGNGCVREVTPAGAFSTAVGLCTNDQTGSAGTALTSPAGLAFTQTGRLIISDTTRSNVYEFLSPGTLNLIAGLSSGGSGPYLSTQDGGAAITVPLSSPQGVAVDPIGNVLVVDSQNNIVRKLAAGFRFPNTAVNNTSPSQIAFFVITAPVSLTPGVGTDYEMVSTSCRGNLTASISSTPTTCGVTVIFKPKYPGPRRSPLTLSDAISSKKFTWGLTGNGMGAEAIFSPGTMRTLLSSLANPAAVRLNTKGDVYLAEAGATGNGDIKFMAAGSTTPTTLIASGAGLNTPSALALDSAGNLYIADKGANSIFEYDANGTLTTFASGLSDPEALAFDTFDNLYVAEAGATPAVREMYAAGQQAIIAGQGTISNANGVAATQARLGAPGGLALDNHGVLYVSDRTGHRVYSIDTGRLIHFLVGNGTTTDTAPGTALGTGLKDPRDLALDAAGDVYIADGTGNRSILVYSSSQQNPNAGSIAGTGIAGNTGDGGPGNLALVNNPISIALDGKANIYVLDAGNQALREIVYSEPSLDFGIVKAHEISPAQTATLWNTGNVDLQVSQLLLLDPTNFSTDAASTLCGSTVLFGATCDYGFRFNPQAAGSYETTATLKDNSSDSQQEITLEGGATLAIASSIDTGTTAYRGVYGTPYHWIASVTGDGTHTPTGTVTFTIKGTPVCPPLALDGSARVTCSPSPTGLSVGGYGMTISYSGDSLYAANSIATTAAIDPAPVTITANDTSRAYGQANPVFSGTIDGVVAGETITATYSTPATQFSAPGAYPIAPIAAVGPGTLLSNYAITIVNGTLTITQAGPVTITVVNATRIYGVPNPIFASSVVNGANGDKITVTYSTAATLNSTVGTYPITAALSGLSAGNYSRATVLPGVLTITLAPTSLALTSSNSSPMTGTAVTFTAIVTSPSQIAPDGSVAFADGGTPMGTGTLDAAGHASFTASALTAATHTITATYPGTIDFTASAATLSQTLVTPGLGGSFSITATPAYQEVRGGGRSIYQITVSSLGGYFGPVTLSCAGLPADAGCAFSPATVTLIAGGSATTQLTATTTLSDALTASLMLPPPGGRGVLPLLAWTMFPMQLSGATLLAGVLGRRRKQSLWKRLMFMIPLALLVLGLSGCGITPFHTYTITVSGAGISGGVPVTETTTVTLSVIH